MNRNSKSAKLLRYLAESVTTVYTYPELKRKANFATVASLKQALTRLARDRYIFYEDETNDPYFPIYADLRVKGKEAVKKTFKNTVIFRAKGD